MTLDANRGHAALRRGRSSQAGAGYFLTLCTDGKRAGLTASLLVHAILGEAKAMSSDKTWVLRCATVMPDHLHLLVTLGERLPLAKALQRLKARTSASLHAANITWERGFFDRRLRPDDDELSLFLYIYLNPYRAGLIPASGKWPYYYCREEDWAWFCTMLESERPHPEWLL